jgi:hypothetical protein
VPRPIHPARELLFGSTVDGFNANMKYAAGGINGNGITGASAVHSLSDRGERRDTIA